MPCGWLNNQPFSTWGTAAPAVAITVRGGSGWRSPGNIVMTRVKPSFRARLAMIGQSLAEHQQIQALRHRLGSAELPFEQPPSRSELQWPGEPGIHQHPQTVKIQQPAVGPQVGGDQR